MNYCFEAFANCYTSRTCVVSYEDVISQAVMAVQGPAPSPPDSRSACSSRACYSFHSQLLHTCMRSHQGLGMELLTLPTDRLKAAGAMCHRYC